MFRTIFRKSVIVPQPQTSAAALRSSLPPPVVGKNYPTYRATDFLVKYPATTGCFFFIPLVILAFLYFALPVAINYDPVLFEITQHRTYIIHSVVTAAIQQLRDNITIYKHSLSHPPSVCSEGGDTSTRIYPYWRMYVLYRPRYAPLAYSVTNKNTTQIISKGFTIFSPKVLQEIQLFEAGLQTISADWGWKDVCWTNNYRYNSEYPSYYPTCAPLNSMVSYFFPGPKIPIKKPTKDCSTMESVWALTSTDVNFYGQSIPDAIAQMAVNNEFYTWFFGSQTRFSSMDAPIMRSQITFGYPLKGHVASEDLDDFAKQTDELNEFVTNLDNYLSSARKNFIDIAWGGSLVTEQQMRKAFSADRWTIALGIVVFLLSVCWQAHSVFIGVCVTFYMILCFMCCIFIYCSTNGIDSLSPLCLLTLYVLVAISLDSMFIFFAAFRHSGLMASHGRSNLLTLRQRVAWIYRKAGVSITVSSSIVFLAFAINISVPIPAFTQFSRLMIILVAFNWYIFMTIFPATVIFHHKHISGRRRNTQRLREHLAKTVGFYPKRHSAVNSFIRQLRAVSVNEGGEFSTSLNNGFPTQPTVATKDGSLTVKDGSLTAREGSYTARDGFNTSRTVRDSDFRRSRRKQTSDFILHIPKQFAALSDMSTDDIASLFTQGMHNVSVKVNGELGPKTARSGSIAKPPPLEVDPSQRRTSVVLGILLPSAPVPLPSGNNNNNTSVSGPSASTNKLAAALGSTGDEPEGLQSMSPTFRLPQVSVSRPEGEAYSSPTGKLECGELSNAWGELPWPNQFAMWSQLAESLDVASQNKAKAAQAVEILMDTVKRHYYKPARHYMLDVAPPVDPALGGVALASPSTGTARSTAALGATSRLGGLSAMFQRASVVSGVSTAAPLTLTPAEDPSYQLPAPKYCLPCHWVWKKFLQSSLLRWIRRVVFQKAETEEEKKHRILTARVKHEGYTPIERAFYNKAGPFVYRLRFGIVILFTAAMIVCASVSGVYLTAVQYRELLLHGNSNLELYSTWLRDFAEQDTYADYSAAWYSSLKEFPTGCQDPTTNQWNMYATTDSCGVCGGSNDCIGCDGVRYSNLTYDSCGVCGGDGTSCNSALLCTYYESSRTSTYCYGASCGNLQNNYVEACVIDSSHCNFNGRYSITYGRCFCFGMWKGDSCSECGCLHGGTCGAVYGTCSCPAPWSGVRCEACDNRCREHGYCISDATNATSGTCKCRGNFQGEFCDDCGCQDDQWCDVTQGNCHQCVMDDCGVCFGNNECKSHSTWYQNQNNYPVNLVWGLSGTYTGKDFLSLGLNHQITHDDSFNLSDPNAQYFIAQVCTLLSASPDVLWEFSSCVVLQWRDWLQAQNIQFPYRDPSTFNAKFHNFIEDSSLWDQASFTLPATGDTQPRLLWIKIPVLTTLTADTDHRAGVRAYKRFQRFVDFVNANAPKSAKLCLQDSTLWVRSYMRAILLSTAFFSTVVVSIVSVVLMLITSSSIRLTIFTILTIGCSLSFEVGIFTAAKWNIGPVECICITSLVGMSCSLSVHMVEGYIEYLFTSQSHLLAPKATRKESICALLLRTGVPLTSSALTLIVASLFLLGAQMEILVRIGVITAWTSAFITFFSMVYWTSWVAVIGPVKIVRSKKTVAIYFSACAVLIGILVLALWASNADIQFPSGESMFPRRGGSITSNTTINYWYDQ